MTVSADEPAVREALGRLASMLEADGYELRLAVESGRLDATIVAGEAACADCLVPKDVLGSMILDKLVGAGIDAAPDDVVVRYPADLTH